LPPFPEPPLKLSDFNFDNLSNDSEFDEWNEVLIVDAYAEVERSRCSGAVKSSSRATPSGR
jgi:hypothetical protein